LGKLNPAKDFHVMFILLKKTCIFFQNISLFWLGIFFIRYPFSKR